MRSDKSVTVTRDTPVTSRATNRDTCSVTSGVTQRVSHATTTTPHHTFFGYLPIHVQSVEGWPPPMNGRYAAVIPCP